MFRLSLVLSASVLVLACSGNEDQVPADAAGDPDTPVVPQVDADTTDADPTEPDADTTDAEPMPDAPPGTPDAAMMSAAPVINSISWDTTYNPSPCTPASSNFVITISATDS